MRASKKKHGLSRPGIFLLAVILMLLPGCGVRKDIKSAERGVEDFHRLYNAGDYAAIHKAAGPDLKARAPESYFVQLLTNMRSTLGDEQETMRPHVEYHNDNGTVWVCFTQKTTFEVGQAEEYFTFQIIHGRALLQKYDFVARGTQVEPGGP